mmetsp:Transcript_31801/g.61190  ORF Transcript_31801/g.61190 Transcript_31801/m.61190 type:complete len:229 (-) Transcript_31801:453-1139(-)|eukprot:5417192-Pleurochrysis_carterae.AAC.3
MLVNYSDDEEEVEAGGGADRVGEEGGSYSTKVAEATAAVVERRQRVGSSDSEDPEESIGGHFGCTPAATKSLPLHARLDDDNSDDSTSGGHTPAKTSAEVPFQQDSVQGHGSSEEAAALPSIEDVLDDAEPSFLSAGAAPVPSYGSLLEESESLRATGKHSLDSADKDAADSSHNKAARRSMPPTGPCPAAQSKKESTREKNKRKQKLGQANFTLKWDRDCGAEKAGM